MKKITIILISINFLLSLSSCEFVQEKVKSEVNKEVDKQIKKVDSTVSKYIDKKVIQKTDSLVKISKEVEKLKEAIPAEEK